jgi:hypothetical protein
VPTSQTSPTKPAPRDSIQPAPLAPEGDSCSSCGVPLATDQRYCLECGKRRTAARVPFTEILGKSGGAEARPTPSASRDWTPLVALGGLGALAIVLIVGVLIGKDTGATKQAAAPQVIRVGGGGSGGAAAQAAATSSFKSDWPAGQSGYTLELGTLPKDATTPDKVQAAKDSASGKGAAKVGALDSDDFSSLPGGKYVIYSGHYSTKAQAAKALGALKNKFPQARVIKVSSDSGGGGGSGGGSKVGKQQLQQLNNLSGDAYAKRSKKLPTTTVLPGKAPPKDNKAPGGGGAGQVIK